MNAAPRRSLSALACALAALALTGCGMLPDWFGDSEPPPLAGERLSIIALERAVEPDPALADLAVVLPEPRVNTAWPQVGGTAGHAMHHLAGPAARAERWRASIGAGSHGSGQILAPPVAGADLVFTMDADSVVSAFDAESGTLLWRSDPVPEDEEGFGGGLALAAGMLYVTTGFGQVLAYDAASGMLEWRATVGIPMRAPPTVAGGRVFAVSHDNRLWALDGETGEIQWSHVAIAEMAGLLGGASPAVDGEIVVAPYSSGELVALRVENGRTVWADTLALQGGGVEALAAFNDIDGSPVIDRGTVFANNRGERLVAADLRTGGRLWEQDVGGLAMPWVAGEFLFVTTTDGDLLCLTREDGRIRWVHPLPRFEDPEDREDPIFWTGPVLVGGRLLVGGSNGELRAVSPSDGSALGTLSMPGAVRLPPIVVGETLFVLTDNGVLIALG